MKLNIPLLLLLLTIITKKSTGQSYHSLISIDVSENYLIMSKRPHVEPSSSSSKSTNYKSNFAQKRPKPRRKSLRKNTERRRVARQEERLNERKEFESEGGLWMPQAIKDPGQRRQAVHLFWLVHAKPSHKDLKFVHLVMKQLHAMPRSLHWVKEVIKRCEDDSGTPGFDITKNRKGQGRKESLSAEERQAIASSLVVGTGTPMITAEINADRVINGAKTAKELVSENCVRTTMKRHGGQINNRGKKKTGKTDQETKWAKARLALCTQLKYQLEIARRKRNAGTSRHDKAWVRMALEQIMFVDEKHMKCVLGNTSRKEWRFYVDKNTIHDPDNYIFVEEDDPNGELIARSPNTVGKFMKECRGVFGVMMKKPSRRFKGFTMKPYNYTGRKVVGPKHYEKEMNKEINRVKTMKSVIKGSGHAWSVANLTRTPNGPIHANPYQARYPNTWEVELKKAVNRTFCNITDIMDHIIDEGNRLYADTIYKDNWIIWHDMLSQWWTPEAQAHMASRGMQHRQVKALGKTNALSKRYKGKLIGDSPELMPLDNNLFADLMNACKWNQAATRYLGNDDPRKFKRGTPEEAWSTMIRSWEYGIKSRRIVEDIQKLTYSISEIIKKEGAVVHFEGQRKGRRGQQQVHKEIGTRSQREGRSKAAIKRFLDWPLHPDAFQALEDRRTFLKGKRTAEAALAVANSDVAP